MMRRTCVRVEMIVVCFFLPPGGSSLVLRLVALHVQRQVIGASEGALADVAFERFGTRVLPVVTGQFVGPGKPPLTFRPMALVWLLSCVYPLMGFQM